MSRASSHREVERKLRVSDAFVLPDLIAAGVAESIEELAPFDMRAAYHDTSELTLFRWGVTLRRREGGPDAGWHLKLPVPGADGSTRDELHAPLGEGAIGSVPSSLVSIVAPLLREKDLEHVATLATLRAPVLLRDANGIVRAELVDDHVTVSVPGHPAHVFREIEIEAIDPEDPASLAVLDNAVSVLLTHGATVSSVSKAAEALGPRTSRPADIPDFPFPKASGLAVEAIRATFSLHARHLLLADVAVRRDLPDAVHQMRVAARRLRGTIDTFAPLLDSDVCAPIAEDLKWLANELGAVRDTEVLLERLAEDAARLESTDDTARARRAIDSILNRRLAAGRSSAIAALRSDRHQQLIEDLIALATQPPVRDEAFRPSDEVLLPLVARSWKRLRAAVDRLELDGPSAEWHRARIRAKRARYACEAVVPMFGKRMARLALALAAVTDVLGEHQDAHVAQQVLREMSNHPDLDGPACFTLGLLHEHEAETEVLDRFTFTDVWPTALRRAGQAGIAR